MIDIEAGSTILWCWAPVEQRCQIGCSAALGSTVREGDIRWSINGPPQVATLSNTEGRILQWRPPLVPHPAVFRLTGPCFASHFHKSFAVVVNSTIGHQKHNLMHICSEVSLIEFHGTCSQVLVPNPELTGSSSSSSITKMTATASRRAG